MVLQQSEVAAELGDPLAVAGAAPLPPASGDGLLPGSKWRWLRQIPTALCVVWLVAVVFGAVFASWLPLKNPEKVFPVDRLQGFSGDHWFGTDNLGRDIFSRAVYGARVSLTVSVCSVAVGLLIGSAIGIVAGYLRGRVDTVLSWFIDVVMSFPSLVLLIALVAFTGGGLRNITLALAFLGIPVYARLARAHALSIGGEEFVLAARASGAGRLRVLWREIMPNVLPSIMAYGLIAMSLAIVVEGSLSYLGLSVSQPTPSWGGLIATGQSFLRESASAVFYPAVVLCLTVLSLNVLGERLRRRVETGAAG
jgi:peptide/nickel transport system permease protein